MGYGNIGVLLMAGSSTRMGGTIKQFHRSSLSDRPMYMFSLTTLDMVLDDVVLVVPKGYVEEVEEQVKSLMGRSFVAIEGGESRSESVHKALTFIKDRYGLEDTNVVIHDAARPFVPESIVRNVVRLLDTYDAVTPILDSTDSLMSLADGRARYIERDHIKRVQTPQGFKLKLLYGAYEALMGESKTDDYQLVSKICNRPCVCKGSPLSFKVTTKDDLEIFDMMSGKR